MVMVPLIATDRQLRVETLTVAVALILAACGIAGTDTETSSPGTASPSSLTTTTTTTTTSPPPTTMSDSNWAHPAEDAWIPVPITWAVTPADGDQPALGPVSPEITIPAADDGQGLGGLFDGYYALIVTRPSDPPGVLTARVRPLVSCTELPGSCPPGAPEDGVVDDPDMEIIRTVFMDETLDVIIRPLGDPSRDGETGIRGSGWALYELLSGGWCGGYLESPLPRNCGIATAFADWIWQPSQDGRPIEDILEQIRDRGLDPEFPLRAFVHEPGLPSCPPDRGCLYAYRGPHSSHLVLSPSMVASDVWPGESLYGWWTSLLIRDGRPIIYIDTAQIAG
jgi:hypothetical protein